ncbi:hypothetical protein N7468_005287 [Penicillium chermesinum]|uniref:Short-chain dehydrogenase n=1 Tax=Penicillium chermesinum TaxID=63820 RepID=A0A9W9NZ78_9EURO|nr:uncharacterized protein N7468_005287 [Penicillium chermesinum]KAJ5232331.1 hypothetical protein N7468_005287 [Penicillium chermesinum]
MSFRGTVLVLGAGLRVGHSTAALFAQHGYRVALVARSLAEDLADLDRIPSIFLAVEQALGPPNVVVFNGGP